MNMNPDTVNALVGVGLLAILTNVVLFASVSLCWLGAMVAASATAKSRSTRRHGVTRRGAGGSTATGTTTSCGQMRTSHEALA